MRNLAVLLTAVALSACAGGPAPDTAAPTAVPRSVTITSAQLPQPEAAAFPLTADAPRRVVTLAMGTGETIAALGAGDRLVGRDEASSGPPIDGAPVVTKAHAFSAEAVLALAPDLVIVDAGTSPPEAIDQLRAAGVRVVEVPQAWSVADVPARVRAIATAVGAATQAADAVIAASEASRVQTAAPGTPRVAFLYLRGTAAVYLLGGQGSGADDLITRAGGIDAGAQLDLAAFTPLTPESLAAADPDVLLVMTEGLASVGGVDGLRALPGVAQTRAGREGRVIAVDDTLLLSFGPRTGALVDRLAAALAEVPVRSPATP